MRRKKIIVMGFMGNIPIAGVIWQHLHYIVGLQRLGHEVYYIEDTARYPYNPLTWCTGADFSYAAQTLFRLADEFDFQGRWSFCARYLQPLQTAGLEYSRIAQLYREADAILNVCGTQELNEDILRNPNILYLESDPGLEQIRIDSGDQETLDEMHRHRALFTFGENVGTDRFPVPNHDFRWLPTRQPIVTDLWHTPHPPPAGAIFTSVANWNTSGLKDIEWRGEKYLWSKSLEFLKFVEAPARAGEPFELATDMREPATRQLFAENHWRLTSPEPLSNDHAAYRRYLQHSKGEFTVAKDQYVRLHTAWFSDRSACYLAAGRPVITQETGFTRLYGGPSGHRETKGLFAFSTLEEIPEAVRAINADYPAHARAAHEIATEYFEATKVLSSLLDRAGI